MTPTLTDTQPEAPTVPDSERKGGCSAMPGSALLACPFCGGRARFSGTYDEMSGWGDKEWGNVYCAHCGIRTPDENWNSRGLHKDEATKIWNERDMGRSHREKQQRLHEDAVRASLNSAAL